MVHGTSFLPQPWHHDRLVWMAPAMSFSIGYARDELMPRNPFQLAPSLLCRWWSSDQCSHRSFILCNGRPTATRNAILLWTPLFDWTGINGLSRVIGCGNMICAPPNGFSDQLWWVPCPHICSWCIIAGGGRNIWHDSLVYTFCADDRAMDYLIGCSACTLFPRT